ncbi:MAG: ATP-binding protein [Candidatus Aminicenantales bacterium]
MKRIKFLSDLTEVEKVRSFLHDALQELNLSDKAYYIIELSLMEICINIIRYAYPGEKGYIYLKTWREGKRIFLEIKDSGIPFDPTRSEIPDIEEMIKNERRGGLGIFLARKLMDGFDYRREKNHNVLTMYKEIRRESGTKSV